ncbi:MAG: hypothetical protein JKY67_17800 [Pseudomonadales bacterium]|nr:hypothetical protein [Pseudomonadales bacterium]
MKKSVTAPLIRPGACVFNIVCGLVMVIKVARVENFIYGQFMYCKLTGVRMAG